MFFSKKSEKVCAVFRLALVLYFLVAPRVVCHRHADVRASFDSGRILAVHLDHWHASQDGEVPEWQFHFHLSFALQPSDFLAANASNIVAFSADDTRSFNLLEHCNELQLTYHGSQVIPSNHFFLPDSLVRKLRDAGDFRRVLFGVWQI